MALLCCTLGNITGEGTWLFDDVRFFDQVEFASGDALRLGAVLLGGFAIGFGDNLGSVAMETFPPGVAFPVCKSVGVSGGGSGSRVA